MENLRERYQKLLQRVQPDEKRKHIRFIESEQKNPVFGLIIKVQVKR